MPAVIAAALASGVILSGATCFDRDANVKATCVITLRKRPTRSIDLRGKYILPAFVDNHVHLGRVKADSDVWLRAGVTKVVENGSAVAPVELARRYPHGPRINACGPILTKRGGYPETPSIAVAGAKDAGERTARLIRELKPHCIKIAVERGFDKDLHNRGWPTFDREEVEAVVAEARAHGLMVHAHVTQQREFDLAVNGGVRVITHAPIERLTDPSLRNAAERGVIIVSTVAMWDRAHREAAVGNLVRFVRFGGAIAVGSDYPNWPTAGLPIAEIRALRDGGLTMKQILVALMRDTTMPRSDPRDFVVLPANPLSSVDALSQVELVVRDGVIVFP